MRPKPDPAAETSHLPDPRITEFESLLRFPEDIKARIDDFEKMRQYVHTDAMLLDTETAVGANFVLRGQYAVLAQIAPRDPQPVARPYRAVGDLYTLDLVRYAETHEALVLRQQYESRLKQVIDGALQDAQTVPFVWIKARFQSNPNLDENGYSRHNDQQDTLARYQWLKAKDHIIAGSAEERELRDLEVTVRQIVMTQLSEDLTANPPPPAVDEAGQPMMSPLTGEPLLEPDERMNRLAVLREGAGAELEDLPEVGVYKGWVFEQVDAEDMRWDWSIRRYEDLYAARWMAHRVFMFPQEALEKFGLSEDELGAQATLFDAQGKVVIDASAAADDHKRTGDVESSGMGRRIAVWELHHRVLGKTFVWVQGMDQFAMEYVSPARGRAFFPFFLVQVQSRVTGSFVGRSPTELQIPLQDELNMLRTHGLSARKSAHPKYVITKNALSAREKDQLEQALPYSVTELERASEIQQHLKELIPANYNPLLYDRSDTFLDWQAMAGLPMAAIGGVGAAKLATEAAIANEQMGEQADLRGALIQLLYADIYAWMMQVNAQMFDTEEVKAKVGQGAVWPEFESRTALLDNFAVEVQSELSGRAAKAKALENWTTVVTAAQTLGAPLNPIAVMADLLKIVGVRRGLDAYLMAPDQAAGLAAVGIAGQAGGAANTPSAGGPEDQGAEGEGGGRPQMDTPPPPEKVNNSPAAVPE